MSKDKRERVDTVLYARFGRADERPILSVACDDDDCDAVIEAKKAEVIAECSRSGAVRPTFRVEKGRVGAAEAGA